MTDLAYAPAESTEQLQQGRFVRLHAERAVWVNARDCLAVRFPHAGCNACVRECPVDALDLSNETWALNDDCLNCGRCAARCPTDALVVTGFERGDIRGPHAAPLWVDCERVPEASSPESTLRVPCLGGLGTPALLQLAARSTFGVQVLDRGLCVDCPAGSGIRPPVFEAVEHANALLTAIGVSIDRHLRLEQRSFSGDPMPVLASVTGVRKTVSRRGLWKALASEAVRARETLDPHYRPASLGNPAPPDGRARITPRKRFAVIRRLRSFADAPESSLPQNLFPHLGISSRCRDHNLCVHLCPTGALGLQQSATRKEIRFDPERCIECSACIDACPEGAMNWQGGKGDASGAIEVLAVRETRICAECGSDFVEREIGHDDDSLPTCPACSKSRQLMQSVFSDLFARRSG
jgi:ferredoxin